MKILALDTSSRYGSIALCDGPRVLLEVTRRGVANESEHLVPLIQRALDDVGWSVGVLDAFGVVHGPGSFTGIRVGLATVEGLAMATGRPAVGISSLEALAWGMPAGALPVCSVLNARRGELYVALYERRPEGVVERLPACTMTPADLAARLDGDIIAIGDGAALLAEARQRLGDPGRTIVPAGSSALLRASVVAVLAARRLERLGDAPVPPLRPSYIRETSTDLGLRRAADRTDGVSDQNRHRRRRNVT